MRNNDERERAAQYKIWRDGYPDTYDGHGHVHPPRELPEWARKFSDACAEVARREERKRCRQIGIDFLNREMSDDEYWTGGRGIQEGVAMYVKWLAALDEEGE